MLRESYSRALLTHRLEEIERATDPMNPYAMFKINTTQSVPIDDDDNYEM